MTEDNENAFKHLINNALLKKIAVSVSQFHPSFKVKEFISLKNKLADLELKSRVYLIRDELQRQLPAKYPQALKILLQSLKATELRGFEVWPYAEFIQTYGLEHPDLSLRALRDVTRHFTAEWAVRPFVKKYPEKTMIFLLKCAQDKDVHLRRWASEGTRPRLPWGERLQGFVQDPKPTLSILEELKFDDELYVRKSVSNHLNDIAKDHPEYVINILTRWKKEGGIRESTKINWIINRALRNLIKAGHAEALQLIGVSKAKIGIENFRVKQKKIKLGERLDFEITLKSKSSQDQKLVIDYIVHFVKANNATAPKIFKLKTINLPAKETTKIEKTHHFKTITTRDFYTGLHSLEIQINGKSFGKQDWVLKV